MDDNYIYPVHFNSNVINYYGGVLEPIPGMEEPNPYSHKDDTGSTEDSAIALFRDVIKQVHL